MKTLRHIGMLLIAVILLGVTTACGNDKDKDEPTITGGTPLITLNGTPFSVSNAYWTAEKSNENTTWYTLFLFNCNENAVQSTSPFMAIVVSYKVDNGSTDTYATGEFNDFQVSLAYLSTDETKDRWYYAYGSDNDNNAKLKVTRNEGNVTIAVGAMKYFDEQTNLKVNGSAFSFTGSIARLTNINIFNPYRLKLFVTD